MIPEPVPPFPDRRSCEAMEAMRLPDLRPFAALGTTIVAVRTACIPVNVKGGLAPQTGTPCCQGGGCGSPPATEGSPAPQGTVGYPLLHITAARSSSAMSPLSSRHVAVSQIV